MVLNLPVSSSDCSPSKVSSVDNVWSKGLPTPALFDVTSSVVLVSLVVFLVVVEVVLGVVAFPPPPLPNKSLDNNMALLAWKRPRTVG